MAYELSDRLVVGVASSALFDLAESDAYFREHGEAAYRRYQEDNLDAALAPGVAFPFIRRLLLLNDLRPNDPLVEVIVLSRNDPDTGLRVMRSIESHKLPVTRAVFTKGLAPYDYIGALEMSLFLTANRPDVDAAITAGHPAGHVLPSYAAYDDNDSTLRIAFDFDGVLADDAAERVFQVSGLNEFAQHEVDHRAEAHEPGILQQLLADLNRIQRIEDDKAAMDPSYKPRLRVAMVTARNAPAHERAIQSLKKWGLRVDDAFFLGGIDKARILRVMRPHVYFDDQDSHLQGLAQYIAGVHVPYGIANEGVAHLPRSSGNEDAPGSMQDLAE